jgi:signal transduction histidine kinase
MRRGIVGLALLGSMLAIALFGIPLAAAVVQYALVYQRGELERVADTAAMEVAADLVRSDPLPPLPPAPEGTDVSVFDHHGQWLAGAGPMLAGPQVRAALGGTVDARSSDGTTVVAIPVTHDGDVIGAVRAASPHRAVYGQVGWAWLGMFALAVLAVGTVWMVARRQARRLAQPLEDISRTARRLGGGDFSVRAGAAGVPEIDAVASAINNAADRLDQLVARERAFSAEASHQLRTPLTGLRLRLEQALDQPGHDLRPAISSAIAAADRLERTIDELLALARGNPGAEAGMLDVDALLDEVRQVWGPRLAAEGRGLRIVVGEALPVPRASAAAVRQALGVLVDNAVVHGAGPVTVAAREATDALAIDVRDAGDGVGAPEGELFARRPTVVNGHGIGLALARRLVEAEGGRLRLTSAAPAVFTLLLPAADDTGEATGVPGGAAREEPAQHGPLGVSSR